MAEKRSILFVDAYDSFTENIKALLSQDLCADITTVRIDTDIYAEFHVDVAGFVNQFDAVVLGPGPGDPRNGSQDTGLFTDVLRVATAPRIPVLGICLGFQTLCLRYGLSLQRLIEPCHGHAKRILPVKGHRIFEGINPDNVFATCYNSLGVPAIATPINLDASRPGSSSTNASFGSSSDGNNVPQSESFDSVGLDAIAVDEDGFVMAVAHRSLPFYGFQFHPESCKSNSECRVLLRNWFELVESHNKLLRMDRKPSSLYRMTGKQSVRSHMVGHSVVESQHLATLPETRRWTQQHLYDMFSKRTRSSGSRVIYRQQALPLDRQKVSKFVKSLANRGTIAMLESTKKGRFSIYALLHDHRRPNGNAFASETKPSSLAFSVRNGKITFHHSQCIASQGDCTSFPLADSPSLPGYSDNSTTLQAIEEFMASKQAAGGPSEVPFWGGFIGFMSYELGLQQLDIDVGISDHQSVDDMSLVWVERSMVYDSQTSTITVQSLIENDEQFIDDTLQLLQNELHFSGDPVSVSAQEQLRLALQDRTIDLPSQAKYNLAYDLCQDHLRAGNSYELCLTTEARVSLPRLTDDLVYLLYRNMHEHNPVPYGALLNLETITILSTSPEEFMSWDRTGKIDMRPMKGTVKRSPSMTLARATEILSTPKEFAENLMIADLIRHDLYAAVGHTSKVEVVKLCEVIQHETVYQLVSHIQASAPVSKSISESSQRDMAMRYGFKALTRSLPPGSMTGAPKKRSCEILHDLERRNRGLYSGIIGYFDVGGGGAWNVCIRTAFKVKSQSNADHEWRIGAGGAITVLSDRQAEWEEMQTKLDSVLKGFTKVSLIS